MAYLDLSFSGLSYANFHPAIIASFPLWRHVTQLYDKFLKAVKLIPARGQCAAISIVLQGSITASISVSPLFIIKIILMYL